MDKKVSIRQFPSPEHPYIVFPQKNLAVLDISRFTFCKVDYVLERVFWHLDVSTTNDYPVHFNIMLCTSLSTREATSSGVSRVFLVARNPPSPSQANIFFESGG